MESKKQMPQSLFFIFISPITQLQLLKNSILFRIILQQICHLQILNMRIFLNFQLQMTSFNIQSQFLDLKKTYQNFEYEHLVQQGIVADQTALSNEPNEAAYQGMTQNTYLFVQQKNVLVKDIENLALYFQNKYVQLNSSVKANANKNFPFDKIRDRVCFIFQKYQEQPCLLDSLLQSLILPIMNAVKKYLSKLLKENYSENINAEFHSILMIVYQLTKVRGKKYIIQYFPHQTKDLYPAIGYLVRQRFDPNNWESRYVILLWMGVIALMPFNLDTMDSQVVQMEQEEGSKATDIISLMLEIGKFYLKSLTKIREASALFLSKLFTRPDIQSKGLLPKYIHYCIDKLEKVKDNPLDNFLVCGIIYSLQQIFKRVQRKQLLPLIDPVIQYLKKERENSRDNPLKRQLKMKLLKQIGLTYLKPRSAKWAYKKKKQSLLTNLSKTIQKVTIQTNTSQFQSKKITGQQQDNNQENDVDYYRDVNKNNLQEIIDMLVDGLSQKQTTVRQKASKGIGKIAGRLSQDMVVDILDYIFSLIPSPQTQHAVCLTIAELIKRNLVSPERLTQMYQFMKDSLLFQQQQGGYSIGQAVRDAACYMTWSVARGYQQGGYQLGISLMIAACFDRQVGCRRAASAAYQQLVGRVGDVPNGIQILTQADYFTLGLQKNAYLNVAIFVASYQSYFKPFVEHLCYQKLRHWDLQIKRIAACSLSLMCPLNPGFIAKQILPSLLKYFHMDQLNVKLGSIIGIGQILLGLKGYSQNHQLQNQMKDSVFLKSLTQNEKKLMKAGQYMQQFKQKYNDLQGQDNFSLIEQDTIRGIIKYLIEKIKEAKIYKGKSGESFRIYTLRLLECFAICQIKLTDEEIRIFQDFIQQNIKNPLEPIIVAAVKCLKPFLTQYFNHQRDQKFIRNIIVEAKASSKALSIISKGYTLAISKFTSKIYKPFYELIMGTLQTNSKVSKENDDPEKRKYAILALQSLVKEIGFDDDLLTLKQIQRIFGILFQAMNDYTMDKRGDIGSIVREASMTCLLSIVRRYVKSDKPTSQIPNQLIVKMIGLILQQLCQKIDRIRLLAGSLLQNFFDELVHKFNIPSKEQLKLIFEQGNIKKLIKESQNKIDSNLETQVIKMEMKIQQTIFMETERYLIYFWNLPHSTFPLVVPLLKLQTYSYYILKGLCTSTGGISQSIIKYSLQELGNYITYVFQGREQLMHRLFQQILQLMKQCFKDERIIVPLYKTLDFILERQQVISWKGIHQYDLDLFAAIQREVSKTKSIIKVSAATGLYVALLSLNNPQTKKQILSSIVKILCSDLPKARKVLADKLMLLVMSQQEQVVFEQEATQILMTILSENDFLDEKLDVEIIKAQIKSALNME